MDKKPITLSNNGCRSKYSGACFWISIHDYLTKVKKLDIDFDTIRSDSNSDQISDLKQIFDSSNQRYVDGINNLCTKYNIYINVYSSDNKPELIDYYPLSRLDNFDQTDKQNQTNIDIIKIMSFGLHFELICD